MFVAGERGDPKTFSFFSEHLEVPLIDHWYVSDVCIWMGQLSLRH